MSKNAIAAGALYLTTVLASAAGNPLSVHVLNTQDGLPSPGVNVVLERMENGIWSELSSATTDPQGRVRDLFPPDSKLEQGIYKVTFQTGPWFAARNIATFFPEIPIIFQVDGTLDHYHIPLLLSPFGYSTYRGN